MATFPIHRDKQDLAQSTCSPHSFCARYRNTRNLVIRCVFPTLLLRDLRPSYHIHSWYVLTRTGDKLTGQAYPEHASLPRIHGNAASRSHSSPFPIQTEKQSEANEEAVVEHKSKRQANLRQCKSMNQDDRGYRPKST